MIVGIIMTAGTLLGELVPDFLMGLFTQTPSTVEIGRTALRIISGLCHVNGFRHCFRRV